MTPPRPITRYNRSTLQAEFAQLIESESGQDNVEVLITSTALADVDHDGSQDDLFGAGLVQVGSRFKSFVFMRRDDGAARFFDSSGARLDLSSDMRMVHCFESRAWLCRPAMERALRQISRPRVSMLDYDASRSGLELLIHQSEGRFVVLNSLEVFAAGHS